jgi:hypothetical protein
LVQIGAEVPAPSWSCSEVPAPANDKEEMLDYEPLLVREDMDVNVIYLSSIDYSLVGDDEVVEMSFGPRDTVFHRPKDSENHLKPLYTWGHLDGMPISRMLIGRGAIINLMRYAFFKKMGKSDEELFKANMMINDVGSKTLATPFFIAEVQGNYNKTLATPFFMPTIAYLLPCINS